MVGLMIVIVCMTVVMSVLVWRLRGMRKDVCGFAERMEKNLDDIISGKPAEYVQITEDTLWGKVSEKLQKTERIFKSRERELADDKRVLRELISDISHQTKTPVANQKLCIEILQQEALSEKGSEFLTSLEKQTDKLDFLFQSMVKMSRLETGIIRVKIETADLVWTVGQAIAEIVPAATDKNISIFADCEKEVRLPHDSRWTEEAVFNILDNAVKYTEAGGTVRIAVVRQEIFTKISIKDSGKGILKERQAQIFTRFYREPEVHGQEGIGIGLFLARKIIELQNGYIEVRSETGEGAEFQIFLPNAHP